MTTTATEPVLSVSDIHKSFGDTEILRGVGFDLAPGETLALIGASGSGKSTLLRCVGMLDTFEQGSIKVGGETVATGEPGARQRRESRDEARRRAKFGFVFQQFNLFGHRTAIENVMEGPVVVRRMTKAQARRMSMELLDRVGVAHRADASLTQMSGGEQQRVAIARAMAMEPECLLLDEPTSALDPELVAEVLDVVAGLAREGMSMVIVTHEMGFAYEVADRVAFLYQGCILEEGTARRLLTRPNSPQLKSFLRRFHYSAVPPLQES